MSSKVIGRLRAALDKNSVRDVIICDDAFDLTAEDLVDDESWMDFRSAFDQDTVVREELEGAEIVPGDRPNMEILRKLHASRPNLTHSAGAVSDVLSEYDSELAILHELQIVLESCGLTVTVAGTDFEVSKVRECDLAFVDFFLNPNDAPSSKDSVLNESFLDKSSVRRAQDIAVEIYRQTQAYIVLMSSFQDVSRFERAFRQRTNFLLRGFFRFVSKDQLTNELEITERLMRLPLSKDARRTIAKFVSATEAAAEEAITTARKTLRELGVEDYAYLSELVLRKESYPLGDYLLRLFGSHATRNLQEQLELGHASRQLDKLVITQMIPLHDAPSSAFLKMYSAHVTQIIADDNEGGWASHPQFGEEEKVEGRQADGLAQLPFLQFGDLLTLDAESEVFAILNPGCDLMFGPERKDRQVDDSVFLLPGRLRPLHEPISEGRKPSSFTWLVQIEGESRRVEWDFHRFLAERHASIKDLYQSRGYVRRMRLRLGAALELQQRLLAHLGRVGVEVPPPLPQWFPCSIYCKASDGNYELIAERLAGMVVSLHSQAGDTMVFTDTGRTALIAKIGAWLVQACEEASQIDDPTRLDRRRTYLTGVSESLKEWRLDFPMFDDPVKFPGGRDKSQHKNRDFTQKNSLRVSRCVDTSDRFPGCDVVLTVHTDS